MDFLNLAPERSGWASLHRLTFGVYLPRSLNCGGLDVTEIGLMPDNLRRCPRLRTGKCVTQGRTGRFGYWRRQTEAKPMALRGPGQMDVLVADYCGMSPLAETERCALL